MSFLNSDLFQYLFMGVIGLLAIATLVGKIYSLFPHSHVGDRKNLRPDAKVSKVDKQVVGSKNDKKIQTIVTFEDGFQYESYLTDRENHLTTYRIGVSQETMRLILAKAEEAHSKACRKA